jgi:hypothetical protein
MRRPDEQVMPQRAVLLREALVASPMTVDTAWM